ncbi:MAG: hypothetical protein HQK66_15105 [Desulfamplus sp.]|nr:hypothetical protein [Desulfamplus sp.]
MAPEELVSNFLKLKESLEEKYKKYEEVIGEYSEKQLGFDKAIQKYSSLKDPFLQQVKREIPHEQEQILKTLYGFAGIDEKKFENNELQKKSFEQESQEMAAVVDSADKEKWFVDLEAYQNMISTKFKLTSERTNQEEILANSLKELSNSIDNYIMAIFDVYSLTREYQKTAIVLKQEVSRGNMEASKLPDGYEKVLKSDQT